MTGMDNNKAQYIAFQNQKRLDKLFIGLTRGFAFLVFALLVAIMLSLLIGALPAIKSFGWDFLVQSNWDPVNDIYSAAIPIYGTLITSFIALLIAVPVSFGVALFLTELCPLRLRRLFGVLVELLAGIPSIIYGMWGLFVFAPWFSENLQPWLIGLFEGLPILGTLFSGPTIGIGIFTAALILAIMVIPFISSVMRDVFEVVPSLLKESAYGLGATTWEVVRYVVLPYTKVGVVGGIMLGFGRALGETMAVTFVIGNATNYLAGLFQPSASITSVLANEFTEAMSPLHIGALLELGMLLFLITFFVLACAKLLLRFLHRQEGNI